MVRTILELGFENNSFSYVFGCRSSFSIVVILGMGGKRRMQMQFNGLSSRKGDADFIHWL